MKFKASLLLAALSGILCCYSSAYANNNGSSNEDAKEIYLKYSQQNSGGAQDATPAAENENVKELFLKYSQQNSGDTQDAAPASTAKAPAPAATPATPAATPKAKPAAATTVAKAKSAQSNKQEAVTINKDLAGLLSGKWVQDLSGQKTELTLNLNSGRYFYKQTGLGVTFIQEVSVIKDKSDFAAYANGEDKPYTLLLAKKGENKPYLEVKCTEAKCNAVTTALVGEESSAPYTRTDTIYTKDLLPENTNAAGYDYRGDDPSDGDIPEDMLERTDTLFGALSATWQSVDNPNIQVDICVETGHKPFMRIISPNSSLLLEMSIGENDNDTYYNDSGLKKVQLLNPYTRKALVELQCHNNVMGEITLVSLVDNKTYKLKEKGGLYLNQLID